MSSATDQSCRMCGFLRRTRPCHSWTIFIHPVGPPSLGRFSRRLGVCHLRRSERDPPPDYFAEFQVKFGTSIEVDVATFAESSLIAPIGGPNGDTRRSRMRKCGHPRPDCRYAGFFPDDIEVQIFSSEAGPTLVAAIEPGQSGKQGRDRRPADRLPPNARPICNEESG